MAVRSGAGTGVIVSLVVFVLLFIFALVIAIVFHSGQQKAVQAQTEAEDALAKYVSSGERSNDRYQALEASASGNRQSVAAYLASRTDEFAGLVTGNPQDNLEAVKSRLQNFGVDGNITVVNVLEDLTRQVRARDAEIANKDEVLGDKDDQISQLNTRIADLRQENDDRESELRSELQGYISAAQQYQQDVQDTISAVEQDKERFRSRYDSEIEDLEDRNDDLNQELVQLRRRVRDLQEMVRTNSEVIDPSRLVDARVVDLVGDDEVYIDRGRRDRIVRGMTFEVYDTADSIRPDVRSGELPRGKASLQVTQVGDHTAKCKITRAVPGRPVVSDDVLANAVYDPNYQFKFLVHGLFDHNGDGRPTEAESDYIRSLIIDWGGVVVSGDVLPGDLDFLVLGVEPRMPAPLGESATPAMVEAHVRKRQAFELYNTLFRQAREAQIPVLNANRFFILTGYTNN